MSSTIPRPATIKALRSLISSQEGPRLSIYVPLPESRGFDEIQAFPSTYSLTVSSLAKRLASLGVDDELADDALSRLNSVEADLASLPRATKCMAAFSGPTGVCAFALPCVAGRSASVGRSYRVRPLLRATQLELSYRVLAVATNHVALFEGDTHGLREVEAPSVPSSLEKALGSDLTERSLQYHSTSPGGKSVTYHGHGGASRGRSVDQERFHRVIAKTVAEFWGDRDDPLVLATDPSHDGPLRKMANLTGLLAHTVSGNHERSSQKELRKACWPIIESWAQVGSARAAERARDALAHAAALDTLEPAVQAAVAGRVSRVWIDADKEVPGHIDASNGGITDSWGDEDVLDELACLVAAKGGDIIVFDEERRPTASSVVAELRG